MFYFIWPIPDGSEEDMSVGVGFWRNTLNKRVVISLSYFKECDKRDVENFVSLKQ